VPSWLYHLRFVRPLRWVLPALALGCGPQGATPLPEPPALATSGIRLSPTVGAVPLVWPAIISVEGAEGTVSVGAMVRVTNLDDRGPTTVATSNDVGAFVLRLTASPGNELRLDAEFSNTLRSAPIDLVFTGSALMSSTRFGCLTVQPDLELPFAQPGSQRLVLANACATPITVQSASARLSLPDFTLTTALPLSIPVGNRATLDVEFNPSSPEPQEDVLFLLLDDGASTLRYPITLYRPPSP
jgi:hypothetical protein